jgi:hypothetical protein
MRNTRALAAGLLAGAALCAPAAAHADPAPGTPPAVAPLDACRTPSFLQALLAFKDRNYYPLAPGGDFGAAAAGWQLAGGARIVDGTQPDGTAGGVLDLPSGAQATSPPMCITADYPTARLHLRSNAGKQGVYFSVQYYRSGAWTAPKQNGQFRGAQTSWMLSPPMHIQPGSGAGWQQVRFTFLSSATTGTVQVDDFWVDPRLRF